MWVHFVLTFVTQLDSVVYILFWLEWHFIILKSPKSALIVKSFIIRVCFLDEMRIIFHPMFIGIQQQKWRIDCNHLSFNSDFFFNSDLRFPFFLQTQ